MLRFISFLFSPLNGHTNYVKVIKDEGCWSQIGMVGNGEQELSLAGNLGGIMGIGYSKKGIVQVPNFGYGLVKDWKEWYNMLTYQKT